MNETTNLFIMLGLIEDKPDKSNESQEEKDCMNYLSEGERILSLARKKKERAIFKTHNLTVRLCDLKYPRLDVEEYKAKQQIQSAIEREIKKNLKEIKTEECLSRVLSDVWVNPLFSFCLTKPIWWLIANQKIREYPKYRKNPK